MIGKLLGAAAAGGLLALAPSAQADGVVRMASGACPIDRPQCPGPDRPPQARPGECYAKVRTPPVTERFTEQQVVTPARRETRVIPAVYEDFDQQVLVSPERVERIDVPPTYRTVTETVVVSPPSVRYEDAPPQYRTVVDRVMVRPARTEWRRSYVGPGGLIPVGARVEPTGEILCLVEIPAEFRSVEREVMVDPGRRIEIPVPAVTRTVTREVVDAPGRVVERVVPAVYRTERARRVMRAERTEVIDIPAVVRPVTRERVVSPGTEAWSRIDCPADHAAPPPPPGPPPPPFRPAPRRVHPAPPVGEQPGPPPRIERGERG